MADKIENQNKALAVYLMENKDLRLMQNVRNFLGVPFLLTADELDFETGEFKGIKDTFYD